MWGREEAGSSPRGPSPSLLDADAKRGVAVRFLFWCLPIASSSSSFVVRSVASTVGCARVFRRHLDRNSTEEEEDKDVPTAGGEAMAMGDVEDGVEKRTRGSGEVGSTKDDSFKGERRDSIHGAEPSCGSPHR